MEKNRDQTNNPRLELNEPLGINESFAYYLGRSGYGGYTNYDSDELPLDLVFVEARALSQVYQDFCIQRHGADSSEYIAKFINYGGSELVFVCSDGRELRTLLLPQPATEYGRIKQEFDDLQLLNANNPNLVVKPIEYFTNGDKELMVTEYHKQADCIVSIGEYQGELVDDWGVWTPLPEYHFKTVPEDVGQMIQAVAVAILVKLYNEENQLGVGSCEIGGGDFFIKAGWQDKEITYQSLLDDMRLCAVRKLIPIELGEYLDVLRSELPQKNFSDGEPAYKDFLVNRIAQMPMDVDAIELGIEIGLELRRRAGEGQNS